MAEERLQKILAKAGYGSRRSCEELIIAGRVKINGEMAAIGAKADPTTDTIQVDGQKIPRQPDLMYIALNKPAGVISDVETHNDPRPTVRDLVNAPGHLFSVGRLDYESEGLILLTNDGEMANLLTHPRYGHEKEYRVLVAVRPDEEQLEAWRHGVVLEDGYKTSPAQVRQEDNFGKGTWLRVILREGKKRQIREMGKLTGMPVARIVRVRIGGLELGTLKPREWRYLTPDEVKLLKTGKPRRPIPADRKPSVNRNRRTERPSGGRGEVKRPPKR